MKFVWCDDHSTFEEKGGDCPGKKHVASRILLMPDIQPFVSTVTGEVIGGRRQLREHNRVNNVTNVSDYTETWKSAAAQRARELQGHDPSRREDVARAAERVINGSRKK